MQPRDDAVLDLRDMRAQDPSVVGAKAASLARALEAGLAVLPGFVIPATNDLSAARRAWAALSGSGVRPLVVRSSSVAEDTMTASMAGRFTSVTDVHGWDAFVDAVDVVRRSASEGPLAAPMAVLVQPALSPERGGVLFGLDPVTGEPGRLVVESCVGSPQAIVSGDITGARIVLSPRGRVVVREPGDRSLSRRDRRRLARLARAAAALYGGPQDIEWAIDPEGRLWLLQSRPVTAVGHAWQAQGPILGPGPIGETFPDPLRPLERDLFLAPLRVGMIEALRSIGVVRARDIARSPVVTTVNGRVAADLELLGWIRRPRGWGVLNPLPPLRRSLAAWHVGRIRRALPKLALDVVRHTDAALGAVPSLHGLSDEVLLATLGHVREELIRVHGYQMLAGMLLHAPEERAGASALALSAIAAGRSSGLDDAAIVATTPVVLALSPARIGPIVALPSPVPATQLEPTPEIAALGPREALRLRVRWLDELAARIAWTLGERLAARGRLPEPGSVAFVTIEELADAIAHPSLDVRLRPETPGGPPLPATFRLTPAGDIVPVSPLRGKRGALGQGRGAAGGRAAGPVRHGGASVEPGDVLVVRVLSPSLAGELPKLAGLVSETGSTLSHLAILAREMAVPTVVGFAGALDRFPEGTVVVVDGELGEVEPLAAGSEVTP